MSAQILLVEDEPSIADAVSFVLSQDGHQVERVGTLMEARRLWVGADLLVLDVGLPDGNGFDLCREIRKTSNLPILFLTARGEEIDRVVGLELGGDDYVAKPFSPRELAARVKSILRRCQSSVESTLNPIEHLSFSDSPKSTSPQGPLSLGELFVDLERACAVIENIPLDLTRQELLLLHHLAKNPQRVFSRSQLMQAVWEVPDSALERTVDAHIKTLRAKIKAAGSAKEWIQTHRGFGYSLVVD
jgi:two-component system catabolic regulation response regulator CreB